MNLNKRKTGWIARYFNINNETVRTWSSQFSVYLSDNANPESGKTRYFTEEDLEVFALAYQMLVKGGGTYEQVREQLDDGMRGSVEMVNAIISDADGEVKIIVLQKKIQDLTIQLENAQIANGIAVESVAKETQRADSAHEERERVQQKLDSANNQIQDLNRQIGKLEILLEMAKGSGNIG